MTIKQIIISMFCILFLACGEDTLPKPKAYLRLDYPKPEYKKTNLPLPFSFEKNMLSSPITDLKTQGEIIGVDVKYKKLKATVFLSYKEVKNNLDSLLRDAQNITQRHTIKADEIFETKFENDSTKVYGMLYEVGGNAASQAQFYATDSTKHFLSGSLYFYAKPNYDSIYPASEYLKKDIKHLMETLEWKN